MYDIFISHSSKDKEKIVCPLTKLLKENNLNVFLDSECIEYGNILRATLFDAIKNTIIFIIVLSENYFKSNWASWELGVLSKYENDVCCIPIIFNECIETVASTYPFLLEYKYVLINENTEIKEISSILCDITNTIKQDYGFIHIEKTDLKKLSRELREFNNFKLDKIAISIHTIIKDLNQNPRLALYAIINICDMILNDIVKIENLALDKEHSILENFEKYNLFPNNTNAHFQFLYQTQKNKTMSFDDLSLKHEDIYLIELSLFSIIEWYTASYYKKPIIKNKGIYAVYPEDISSKDIKEIYNIESFSLPPALIASPEITQEWFNYNPWTIIGARDTKTKKLIGFLHTLPVSDNYYLQIQSGEFDDTNISLSDLRQYDMPGFYKLYISSFCIHPKYNTTIAFKLIYNTFIDFLLSLATEREIFISHIIADGATIKGESLCKSIGMNKCIDTVHNTTVYEATLIPPSLTTINLNNKQGNHLMAYYKRTFEEYKEYF